MKKLSILSFLQRFFSRLKRYFFSFEFLPFLLLGLLIVIQIVFNILLWEEKTFAIVASSILLIFWVASAILALDLIDIASRLDLERKQINAMLRSISDPVVAYTKNFEVILVNPALERLTGLSRKELTGKVITPELSNDARYGFLAKIIFPSLAPAVVEQELESYPQRVKVKFFEPQELTLEIITTKVVDEKGTLYGFLKVIHNLTREENLKKIQADFITIAAHQLRTPLSGLSWIIESLLDTKLGSLNDTQKDLLQKAKQAILQSIETVEDLLNAAQIEEGKFGFQFVRTDIQKLIEDVLQKLQPSAQKDNIKLIFYRPQPPIKPFIMDPIRIKLVLEILVDNAIKYNVKNGEVRIRLRRLEDKPFLAVSVEDTGIGIAPKEMSKVFTKFFRSPRVVKKETTGTGLGLYLAKNIIQRHGGKIWVKSELNRGSTFTFTLPLDPSYIPPQ